MKKLRSSTLRKLLFSATFFLLSCSTISRFDQHAYIQSTSLKVDALSLMADAGDPYATHRQEIKELKSRMQKAYEYEKFRPGNEVTSKMYSLLTDPKGDLLGGYLTLWESQGKLGKLYIKEKSEQIGAAFDEIAKLEAGKLKK